MLVSPTMIGKSISEDDIGFGYTDFGRENDTEGCDLSKDISTIIPEHELDNSVGLGRTLGGRAIYQKLTTVNYTANSNKKNLYIVIHYTGAAGTAADVEPDVPKQGALPLQDGSGAGIPAIRDDEAARRMGQSSRVHRSGEPERKADDEGQTSLGHRQPSEGPAGLFEHWRSDRRRQPDRRTAREART